MSLEAALRSLLKVSGFFADSLGIEIALAEAAERLQQKSRNAYARYEQGQAVPTIEKLEELLKAIVPDHKLIWRLAG